MQYHTFQMGSFGLAETLNDFALAGWRLIGFQPVGDQFLFVLERPRPASPQDVS
jgi:hypothetical protein